MCLGAIYWAGIRRIVYASDRYSAAAAGFSDNHIYEELALDKAAKHRDGPRTEGEVTTCSLKMGGAPGQDTVLEPA
jgi:tRNA(Arg) A34 adenosine deaminase TadA